MHQPLAIKALDIIVYPPSGWGYKTHTIHNPIWEQVEEAIRDLDHFCRPFIFVGLREKIAGEDCMTVMGGKNGYAISVADDKGGWLYYCDPSHTGGEVPVWTSDQGYYPMERHVTYNLELVLRLVRYYADRGEPDPSVEWEE